MALNRWLLSRECVQQPETSHFALGKPGAAGPPGREAKTAKWRDADLAVLR